MSKIQFRLNGELRAVEMEPSDVLLEVLRDRLGLKSPKCGCDRGDCGACTVLLNGKTVRSCLVLACEVEGQSVETLEGLSREGLTRLQKRFLENNSFQCGYCAPGVVLAATELLRCKARPSREEIREAIAGNLCRCTGYESIVEAIVQAGEEEGVR